VDLGDMPQQQPTIFGDWNCVEMLQPFKAEIGWSGLVPLSPPAINQVNCAYTSGWGDDGTPPPIGSPVDCSKSYAGYFHPNYAGSFFACGQFPLCDLVLFTKYDPVTFVPFYQIKLTMAFYGYGECNPLSVPPLTHFLQVEYATDISDKQFACLNQIRLQWQRAIGNLERQNPDGPGWSHTALVRESQVIRISSRHLSRRNNHQAVGYVMRCAAHDAAQHRKRVLQSPNDCQPEDIS
jgi:hypothetical protein